MNKSSQVNKLLYWMLHIHYFFISFHFSARYFVCVAMLFMFEGLYDYIYQWQLNVPKHIIKNMSCTQYRIIEGAKITVCTSESLSEAPAYPQPLYPSLHPGKCMYLSGLIPEPFTAYDDFRLLDYGIGFTNIVARTTRGSANLTREEIKKGNFY